MRATTMTVLCALQAVSVSAFVAPKVPSPAVRIAKRPTLTMGPGFKLVPSLRPRPGRRTAIKAKSAAAAAPAPLSTDDKRMFVRWSYVMCLFNSLVNSATLIQWDEVVMHMTGPSSKGPLFLAQSGAAATAGLTVGRLATPVAAAGWHNLYTIGAFLLGCLFAGLATAQRDGDTPIAATAPSILFAGLLLLGSGFMAQNGQKGCLYVAACAGGILNGLTSKMTTYRVSHVTGTVTDMGLLIGKGIGSTLGPALSLKLRDLTVLMSLWLVGGCTAFWMSAAIGVSKVMMLSSIPILLLGIKGMMHK